MAFGNTQPSAGGGALTGGAGGAAAGAMVGGPWGALAGAAIGAGLGAYQGNMAEKAISANIDALAEAQRRAEGQASDQTGLDIFARKAQTKKTIGTLRALGLGVQASALETQVLVDNMIDVRTMKQNYGNFITNSRAGYEAELKRVNPEPPNIFLSMLSSAMQGASLGMSLGGTSNPGLNAQQPSIESMRATARTEGGMPY